MNLTTLTHRDALCLNARFTSRDVAIHAVTQRLAALGKISSTEQFLEALANERNPLYEEIADVTIRTDDQSAKVVANQIIHMLESN